MKVYCIHVFSVSAASHFTSKPEWLRSFYACVMILTWPHHPSNPPRHTAVENKLYVCTGLPVSGNKTQQNNTQQLQISLYMTDMLF